MATLMATIGDAELQACMWDCQKHVKIQHLNLQKQTNWSKTVIAHCLFYTYTDRYLSEI